MKQLDPRPNTLVFAQQENESDRAFAGFSLYLRLPRPRTLAAVGQALPCSDSTVTRWCQQHDWFNRAHAYDLHGASSPDQEAGSAKGAPGTADPQPAQEPTGSLATLSAQLPFGPAHGESIQAFEAFLCYLDIGQNRSFLKISAIQNIDSSTIKLWANRYRWQDRVQAYNNAMLQSRVSAASEAHRQLAAQWLDRQNEVRHEEWALHAEAIQSARAALKQFHQSLADSKRPSLTEIARMLELASKLGRLATGMPTDHTEVTGEVGVSVDPEWEAALKKVYGRSGSVERGARSGEQGTERAVIEAEVVGEGQKTERGEEVRCQRSAISGEGDGAQGTARPTWAG